MAKIGYFNQKTAFVLFFLQISAKFAPVHQRQKTNNQAA